MVVFSPWKNSEESYVFCGSLIQSCSLGCGFHPIPFSCSFSGGLDQHTYDCILLTLSRKATSQKQSALKIYWCCSRWYKHQEHRTVNSGCRLFAETKRPPTGSSCCSVLDAASSTSPNSGTVSEDQGLQGVVNSQIVSARHPIEKEW